MNHTLKPPKVSVIIAAHNARHAITDAIQSVLHQSFHDF